MSILCVPKKFCGSCDDRSLGGATLRRNVAEFAPGRLISDLEMSVFVAKIPLLPSTYCVKSEMTFSQSAILAIKLVP